MAKTYILYISRHCLPNVGVVDQQSSPPHKTLTRFMVPNWYVTCYSCVGRCEYQYRKVCMQWIECYCEVYGWWTT